jgi:hypothetical protein
MSGPYREAEYKPKSVRLLYVRHSCGWDCHPEDSVIEVVEDGVLWVTGEGGLIRAIYASGSWDKVEARIEISPEL